MNKPKAKQLDVLVGQAYWNVTHSGGLPPGTSMVVTSLFSGKTPGGSDTAYGVYTTPPQNKVLTRDRATGKAHVDPSTGGQIYARLTEAGGVWTLTFYTVGDVIFNFTGHPDVARTFDFRYCESIQLSEAKPTAVVDYAEGIDEFFPESGILHIHEVERKPVTINGQISFSLSKLPKNDNTVKMFVNGILYRIGIDYNVVATSVAWTNTPFILETNDIVTFSYETI